MKYNATETEKHGNTDILQTLTILDHGRFLLEAGVELQELVDAVVDTNKAGTLTIKLKLVPSGWSKATARPVQFDLVPEVTISKPHHDASKSIFFVDENNTLMRDDPSQAALFGGQ
jgi:hypothetical protein